MAHGLIGVTQLRVGSNATAQAELFCTRLAKRRASLGHLDIDNCSLKACRYISLIDFTACLLFFLQVGHNRGLQA